MTWPTESEVMSHGMTHGLTFGEARRDLMQGRCGTCRWWKQYQRGDDGICTLISNDPRPSDGDNYQWMDRRARAAKLNTAPDFGCSLWEPHDTEGTA